MSFAKVDSSRRVRAALLWKPTPLRGPYATGELVCFHRKGGLNGQGRIIGREGRSTLWFRGGLSIVVAENQIRPATAQKVMVKQILLNYALVERGNVKSIRWQRTSWT